MIETKPQKANKKELDAKSKQADQKRLESLKKMKNSYNEQKQAIKKALASVVSTTHVTVYNELAGIGRFQKVFQISNRTRQTKAKKSFSLTMMTMKVRWRFRN